MNPLSLSDEQRAAAQAPRIDVCVVAGAGSGKTRVLTARFLEHVAKHGIPVRRIAALTFSEKAAREMRTRIAMALAEQGGPAAVADLALAPITTFHGFCARLLRRNALAAGIDPAFRVLDETGAFLLRTQAQAEVAASLETRPDVDALWSALRRLPDPDPLRAADQLLRRLEGSDGEPATLRWRSGSVSEAQARLGVERVLDDVEREAAALPTPVDVRPLRALAEAALAGDAAALERWKGSVTALGVGRGKAHAALSAALGALGPALKLWEGAALDAEGQTLVPALRVLLGLLASSQRAAKRTNGWLDFADLERHAARLLDGLSRRGERPEGLPLALLVDEHQDTNPIQERILAHLRSFGLTQFSVGDPKQSIYRFRRADVGVLLGERARVGVEAGRVLAESYRATPEMVATLGGLFERLFAGGRAGVPYEALLARGQFAPAAGDATPPVEWALLDRGDGLADEGRRGEATYVAARIKDLVERRTPRRKLDERGVAHPPLRWRDCAILVPVRDMFPVLERALTHAAVPFRVHRGKGYLEAEEVRALSHALRVVHDPLDEHALACLLRGPALGATDGRLLTWFGCSDDAGRRLSAWERLQADADPAVARLVAHLEALRRLAVAGGLVDVVAATIDRLDLLTVALAQPDGRRRAANLRRALGLASEVSAAGHHGLADFLAHLEDLRTLDLDAAQAPALADDSDEVALLTIHAAKGLEWPLVVVADAGRKPNRKGDDAYVSADGAVALRLRDPFEGRERPSLGWTECKAADDAAADEEALRLFYVAATRAEERLLVTATIQGRTQAGLLKGAFGWARELDQALGATLSPGLQDLPLGDGLLRVSISTLPTETAGAAHPDDETNGHVEPVGARDAQVAALLEESQRDLAPLKGTRFVVGVSELLAFARSPAESRRARLQPPPPSAPPALAPAPETDEAPSVDPEGRSARFAALHGVDEEGVGASSGALGSALHAALERWPDCSPADCEALLFEACGGAPPAAASAQLDAFLARFSASPMAGEVRAALAAGADLRREVAFHARVRFPGGARVGPFDALLVRGTIDLWLPRAGGLWLVDHKSNAPSVAFPTPESLAAHYAWQLRLYALAAERLCGADVAGASLLLLHPRWGPGALEVAVDVSGAALEETRRLCQAFALAQQVERWPNDWRSLLSG